MKKKSQSRKIRTKLGWLILSMIILLGYGIFRYHQTGDVGFFELNRSCIILFFLWLAWPQLELLPKWILYALPICTLLCAWRPQFLIIALPLSLFYILLRSPNNTRNRKKS